MKVDLIKRLLPTTTILKDEGDFILETANENGIYDNLMFAR